MAKRKTDYTSYTRTKPPTSYGLDICTEKQRTITKIERVETPVRTLKLTLSNGTRYSICEMDPYYAYNNQFDVLWKGLTKGDEVELFVANGAKIVESKFDVSSKNYAIIDIITSSEKTIFNLMSKGEKGVIECLNTDQLFFLFDSTFVPFTEIKSIVRMQEVITVHYIGERLVGFSQ